MNQLTFCDTVYGPNDLKPQPGWAINPPPANGRCQCCGKSIHELKPFGKTGDPLLGAFQGALLVKKFRSMCPRDEDAENKWDEFFNACKTGADYERAYEALIKKYGEDHALNMELRVSGADCIDASWECRDCAVLDAHAYFDKLYSNQT